MGLNDDFKVNEVNNHKSKKSAPEIIYMSNVGDLSVSNICNINHESNKNNVRSKRGTFKYRRILLILLLLPLVPAFPNKELVWSKTLYYIIPSSGISTFVLLFNFPRIVAAIHSKPFYYNDLKNNKMNFETKRQYQWIFIAILQVTITIVISVLSFYYYDRFHATTLSGMEVIGVLGGMLSLLLKIEHVIGRLALFILKQCKNKDEEMFEKSRHNQRSSLTLSVK